jgi:uncharacterized surface protein with fasciclin (FAS1) repeats
MKGIADAVAAAGFGAFAQALRASPYGEVLDGGGPFTLFAPTDAAFEKSSQASLERLLHGDDALLRVVVGYHFAAGKVLSARFAGKRIRAVMYAGGDCIIDRKAGLKVNGANLVKPDIIAGACVIHGVDAVLWPREPAAAL